MEPEKYSLYHFQLIITFGVFNHNKSQNHFAIQIDDEQQHHLKSMPYQMPRLTVFHQNNISVNTDRSQKEKRISFTAVAVVVRLVIDCPLIRLCLKRRPISTIFRCVILFLLLPNKNDSMDMRN